MSNKNYYYYRLKVWKNTLQLFHKYNHPIPFEGPFYKIGLSDYRIEPTLRDDEFNEFNPDIVASNENLWVIVDLTFNGSSKGIQAEKYQNADSDSLNSYGMQNPKKRPEVVISRLNRNVDDGDACQLVVSESLIINQIENIEDESLKISIDNCRGIDLSRLPELPFSFLPESHSHEIKLGLMGIVLMIFQPNSNGLSVAEIVDLGLDSIKDNISPGNFNKIKKHVESAMSDLVSNHLNMYLKLDSNGKYVPTSEFRRHPNTYNAVIKKLLIWADPPQRSLMDFPLTK